jgi:histidinol-phosphate/aromatic aminotransferase/cobyric acid decarboxylase-like protein
VPSSVIVVLDQAYVEYLDVNDVTVGWYLNNQQSCYLKGNTPPVKLPSHNGFKVLGLSYIPSSANFIAVKVGDPSVIYQALLEKGFIVRPVEMKGYLRVSVGAKNENEKFLVALKSVL